MLDLLPTHPDHILDIKGLRCPEPIMMIRKIIRKICVDETVLIISDDPSTQYDIPAFCYFMQHSLLDKYENLNESIFRYLIKKISESK